eukprot:scaffold33509_cov155-Skeletonema_dohrnii-CCMP3373.AAC.3
MFGQMIVLLLTLPLFDKERVVVAAAAAAADAGVVAAADAGVVAAADAAVDAAGAPGGAEGGAVQVQGPTSVSIYSSSHS